MSISPGVGAPLSSKKYPVTTRSEVVKKYPMTQDLLAEYLGKYGDKMANKMRNTCLETLYKRVCNLVYKEAVRYAPTCPHLEVEDMVQDCWHRIIKKLHLYNSERAKFTTWLVKVAQSVLSKIYHRGKRFSDRHTELSDCDYERCGKEDSRSGAWRSDFKEAVELLEKKYPDKAHITRALFYDSGGDIKNRVVFRSTATQCGISAQKVSDFYHQFVKQFFYQTFKGDFL
jgi:RNA polymerase sigma factor (sigma-70 family)